MSSSDSTPANAGIRVSRPRAAPPPWIAARQSRSGSDVEKRQLVKSGTRIPELAAIADPLPSAPWQATQPFRYKSAAFDGWAAADNASSANRITPLQYPHPPFRLHV